MTDNLQPDPLLESVETAILAKCMLQEAWNNCLKVLVQRYKTQQISLSEKMTLENMYTGFFLQVFYTPLKSTDDIKYLLQNTRRMLGMLKAMDENAWQNAISLVNQPEI